ncbi:MAG: transcriptional regulator [Planctomycetota bacterium]|nr:transcriptional regulator [Planctomycetota bacterium]
MVGRDDKGKTVGLEDGKRLLEELPNKFRDLLGIVAKISLRRDDGLEYLEITVPACPNPISYRGRYYQRSGGTLQELKGSTLDRFLLRRYGRAWDGSPMPEVDAGDLSPRAFQRFRELAGRSGRLEKDDLAGEDVILLEKLKLTEGRYLKRAAVALFHSDPRRFFSGAFIKIGYFQSESELAYHDEVEGDLFTQVRQALDVPLGKCLKAMIGYEDIVRVERFPTHRAALREALLNAVVHRDYANPAPTQIRSYADRLLIWNPAALPEGWTETTLLETHASCPFNPDIANAFFRAGEIEAWGRGIERIFAACREAGNPIPKFRFDGTGLWTKFPFSADYVQALRFGIVQAPGRMNRTRVKTRVKTDAVLLKLLSEQPALSLVEAAKILSKNTTTIERAARKLRVEGRLRRVGPKNGGHWEWTFGNYAAQARALTRNS